MKAGIICFTEHGVLLAEQLVNGLAAHGILCEAWLKKKEYRSALPVEVAFLEGTLPEWTAEQFRSKDLLIFIGSTGIAVRSIAPYVQSKKTDPAVIVVDEQGRHAISLLSGHIGGANELTLLVAELTGAEPVITTATDLHGKFAVDAFAARRNLYMDSMPAAKEIAAALVDNLKVGMWSAFPVTGVIPPELDTEGEEPLGFSIDVQKTSPFEKTLHLVPKAVVLGIGCKRGTERAAIQELVEEVLEVNGIFRESICKIASIDLKKDETGILELAESYQVPFLTYPAEELKKAVCEDGFAESAFVESVTGVGNICERSALLAAGVQKLLIPKTARNGVTVAAAVMDLTICMED